MNSILYYQKQRTNALGQKIYVGEDAYPYVDDQIIIVADGLGGRGGFPHTKINPQILNKDDFYNIVFAPVFEGEVSEEFKGYVVNSFYEIFETKDYYFENDATTRSSGYFASRLASAIALYELKYNEDFNKEAIFSKIREASNEQKDAVAQQYGDKLARLLLEKLTNIAERVGFKLESRITGAYLLPSTLTVALTDEKDDSVDVLYLWAGDSRAYLWNSEGLGQITEDHEKDETITNLVTLTRLFRIEARFATFRKPCLLFNATDGCYKCPVFDSPFDLEYIFLKSIEESNDFLGSSEYLAQQFSEIGRHDDSNTMALISFGYEDYEAVRKAVKERLKQIDETIINKLPDILQIDFPDELKVIEENLSKNFTEAKEQLIKEEQIVSFIKEKMDASEQNSNASRIDELLSQIDECKKEKNKLAGEIKKLIEASWIEYPQMKKYSSVADVFDGENPYELYKDLRSELENAEEEYTCTVEGMLDAFVDASREFQRTLELLSDIKQLSKFIYKDFLKDRNTMVKIIDFIKSISIKENPSIVEYNNTLDSIKKLNQKYVELDATAVEEVLNAILNKEIDIKEIKTHPKLLAKIEDLITEYHKINKKQMEVQALNSDISDERVLAYWEQNYEELIHNIWKDHSHLLSEALKATICDKIINLEEKQAEMKKCCEIREQIYADYDVTYKRNYRGSKI